jgi:hypothetical protein
MDISHSSQSELARFKMRALSSYPDLSELQPCVVEQLTARAELLTSTGQLKLYKDIIYRRHIIKQHQDAINNLATLPDF